MHWTVIAPFNKEHTSSNWLSPYVPGNRHEFLFIPRPHQEVNWHTKKVPVTGRKEWLDYWHQTSDAFAARQGGIITVFPQLSVMAAVRKQLSRQQFPLISWWFNTERYAGLKRWLSSTSLQAVDKFVVHNRCEIPYYSDWLGLPKEKFEFVHLQKHEIPRLHSENLEQPFIFATGSGHRDYKTLFEAVERLNLRTIVAPGRHAIAGLTIPPQVELRFDVTKEDIYRLSQQALINVIPMNTEGATGGTVTIVESMRMGCATVVTCRNGVEDYMTHEKNGLLVDPHSLDDLTQALDRLWNDPDLRAQLGKAAYKFAAEHCSDEAAGASLGRILTVLEDQQVSGAVSTFSAYPSVHN